MLLHEIQPKIKNKKKKIVGRGGKRGTYSGRGLKGQKSRAGRKMRPQLRDIIKKIPKKRGYKFKSIGEGAQIANLRVLDKKFKEGDFINPLKLLRAGLIEQKGKEKLKVKILAGGEITKKITISGCEVSESAKQKILKAGGEVR